MTRTLQYDPEESARDDAAAASRFPGPHYYEVLSTIHETLLPSTYLEVGVYDGGSLLQARSPAKAIGIDVRPAPPQPWRTETHIIQTSSDEFFASTQAAELLDAGVDLAFIDGDHTFLQVVRDLLHIEYIAGSGCIVAIHDTIPLDERTSQKTRTSDFYTGDVWKILVWLNRCRPDAEYVTVPTAPSGLSLIRGLGSGVSVTDIEGIDKLSFQYWMEARGDLLRLIPNTPEAVREWLLFRFAPEDSCPVDALQGRAYGAVVPK